MQSIFALLAAATGVEPRGFLERFAERGGFLVRGAVAEHEAGEIVAAGPGQEFDSGCLQAPESLRGPAHEDFVGLHRVFQLGLVVRRDGGGEAGGGGALFESQLPALSGGGAGAAVH